MKIYLTEIMSGASEIVFDAAETAIILGAAIEGFKRFPVPEKLAKKEGLSFPHVVSIHKRLDEHMRTEAARRRKDARARIRELLGMQERA